ncbi:MAG: hypothetical protein E6614_18650 [Bradyrhizobium sp.]|jgi:hypothetical protein|uniref:hypothetical protein n=1 Tax=Bradyrhizobium TaxID=374 RepID=UPI0015574C17|nr:MULTISPECIES: hypothetical protein [unclassified Bradyrhizobium]MDU1497532.1 hypothetical protein [Bradyrhizobium sp.]MDU1547774.1 hypothetical protein [Bradyrhizobium sp.]MDU1666994.1 hypothetical protein [Bradyrhizobium sp.]MDU1807626.1 hypothetical protein [Bradyrhizobium sp.]MDU2921372.1 hypothetical protein [Bradyrhizobium sp.]
MGLSVPIYGYHSAKGTKNKQKEGDGAYNDDNKKNIEAFFDLLRQPLVKDIGVKCGAIYPRKENENPRAIDWLARIAYETETEGRPELEAILNELEDDRGTIVVPNRRHLTADGLYAKELIKRLNYGSIAPIALDYEPLAEVRQPLEKHFRGELRLTDIEQRIKHFFKVLTSDPVRARVKIANSTPRKPFEVPPPAEAI